MEFEWDNAKRKANLLKHKVDFASVIPCFLDAERMVWEDDRFDYGEQRFSMLASLNGRIFFIAFTERGGICRLISARKANKREHDTYVKHRHD